jgi:hypothetical protein
MQQPQQYRAICDFHDDSTSSPFALRVGDLVTCDEQQQQEENDDSWWSGTNVRTKLRGWYPSSHVEPVVATTMPPRPSYPPPKAPTCCNPEAIHDNGESILTFDTFPVNTHDIGESKIPTVDAVPVLPQQQPTWSSVQCIAVPSSEEDFVAAVPGSEEDFVVAVPKSDEKPPPPPAAWTPPLHSAPSSPPPAPPAKARRSCVDAVSGAGQWLKTGIVHSSMGKNGHRGRNAKAASDVGKWLQNGIANSSLGSNGQRAQQTVIVQQTHTERIGSLLFGSFSATSATKTTIHFQSPSEAGRIAKKVGDSAMFSAVYGSTNGADPRQVLVAAAVAVVAYSVEGNQRAKAQQEHEEFMKEQRAREEQARIDAAERRKASSWFKW